MSYWWRFLGHRASVQFGPAARALTQASGEAVATITGQSITVSQGTVTPSAASGSSTTATGQEILVYTSDFEGVSISAGLSGQSISSPLATVLAVGDLFGTTALSGQSVSIAQGAPSASGGSLASTALTGQSITVINEALQAGSDNDSIFTLPGRSISVLNGTLSLRTASTISLTGQLVTVSIGIPTASFTSQKPVQRINARFYTRKTTIRIV